MGIETTSEMDAPEPQPGQVRKRWHAPQLRVADLAYGTGLNITVASADGVTAKS